MLPQLSNRLSAVAALVPQGTVLVDIGTDHGFLPIRLLLEHKIRHAIAMDVRPGPLSRAREHAAEYGLGEDLLELRLGSGLRELRDGEAETMVCAGMGGPLMLSILTERAPGFAGLKTLVLQPQSELSAFRAGIRALGLRIEAEDMVLEDGKFYPMMRVVPAGNGEGEADALADLYGGMLLEQRHPVLKAYLDKEAAQYEGLIAQLAKAPETENSRARRQELQTALEQNRKARERYGL